MDNTPPDNTLAPEPVSALPQPAASPDSPFLVGFRAARANLVPGLCVQVLMLGIVYAYFCLERFRPWFDRLGEYKLNGGSVFTVTASVAAGALLPAVFTLCCLERRLPAWRDVSDFVFASGFYAVNALCVDQLYRWQNVWFGTASTTSTLLKKVLVDQLIYTPAFSAPFAVICFAWKNQNYAFRVHAESLTPQAYVRRVVPTLLAIWTVWIPVVAVLYSLPPLLQIPIYSLALCFWALMLAYIHAEPKSLR